MDGHVASRKKKGKCKEGEDNVGYDKQSEASQENCLATLDIFAGCGGLSEGLRQSGNPTLFSIFLSNAILLNLIISIIKALDEGLFAASNNAGVSLTKWAIEYEEPAGDAFKLNHPESAMFINNCNVILR